MFGGIPELHGDPVFVGAEQANVGSGAVDLDGNDSVVVNGFTGITGTRPDLYGVDQNDDGDGCADRVLGRQEYGRRDLGHADQFAGQLRIQVVGGGGQRRVGGEYGSVGACGGGAAGRRGQRRDVQLYVNGVQETGGR